MAIVEVPRTLEENLIDSIYETEKNKSLISATPLSTAFFSSSIVQDFQDSPDDEEDTRSSHEYLNDLEEEYQARAFLAKSKRFFKKGTQRFSSAKAIDQTECHKCGKKGHFARDCWLKTSVSTYQSPFQQKPLSSSQHKPELRPTKDFEAKYNKVKAKLALLSSSSSASKASMVKNKGIIAEAYEWDEEEVSSYDNEMVEVKVLMTLAEENDVVNKEGARNSEWVKISMRKCDIKKPIWYLDSGCSRHMIGVKSYLHKYVEHPGPKVVFGDDFTCITEGYGSIKCPLTMESIPLSLLMSTQGTPSTLVNFCDENGISQNFSSPYTPEQNGITKRKNRTLIEAENLMKMLMMVIFLDTHLSPRHSETSTLEDNKLKKPITSHLMKALRLSNSQNPQLTTSKLLNQKDIHLMNIFIEPYEFPEPVVLETEVSTDQNDQTNQNDQPVQNDEILNDDHSKHSNHTNDEQIIDSLLNTEDIQISKHLSSPNTEDTSAQNTTIPSPPLHVPSMVTPAPQDRWSQDKHIELVNIIGNPGAGMLTRAMAKQLSAASAHECLFVDFLSEEEPKKVSEALKHPGWVDAMQDELN
ncbi:retrovirus-related pol polyprotein from transposon TNT 1-94 [Tanacetum coccineum]